MPSRLARRLHVTNPKRARWLMYQSIWRAARDMRRLDAMACEAASRMVLQ